MSLESEQHNIDSITIETLEKILCETCKAYSHVRKACKEDYELTSMRACITELEEELELERNYRREKIPMKKISPVKVGKMKIMKKKRMTAMMIVE